MKTIDLLVQALPAIGGWPEKVTHIGQDYDRELMFYGRGNVRSGIILDQLASDHRKCGDSGTKITREQYESALTAKNDGWIEWVGGEFPIEKGVLVDVKLRNGRTEYAQKAHSVDGYASYSFWRNDNAGGDIIAYRPHQPQQEEQPEASEEDLNDCIGQESEAEWNGEGLPPVGTQCEFISNDTSWGTVDVIGFDGDKVVFKPSGETYYGIAPSQQQIFRPIHSEADRKRDEAVKTIMLTGWCQAAAEEIYDLVAAGKVPGMKLED